jgi:3-(3-hydroxy-phenyl)propionate hydroxylase
MLMPGDDPEQMVQPQTLWKLVSPWITPAQADIERAVIYTFHSLIAQGWRKGHLFLAGDAAHQTPPFLGQGMCAAVRDVANLAWKLEAVLLGRASEQLLDSYEAERSPHVHAFIELAVRLGDIIQITDPVKAQERDVRFKAGQPEIFEFPTPRLGPGVCCPDQPLAAQIFGQPVMDDGRRLDAHVGSKFAVLLEPALLGQVSESVRELWQAQNAAVLASGHAQVQSWLEGHGVRAVILRPDRYILGVARNAQELEAVSRCLPAAAACVQ